MPKTTCSCNDDSKKHYTNSAPKYFTYNHFDNTFVVSFQNPSRTLRDMVKNGAPNSLVDRVNCLSCDDSVSSQDKLKVRKKDRPTPYRVPYNHYRKVTSCITDDCLSNVKINKDISCNQLIDCIPTNYAISRQVDKNGVRNINNGGNYKNYLQFSAKSYKLNTFGILPENLVQGTEHTYKIGSVEDTVYNKNSGSEMKSNCLLGYSFTTSQNDKSISYKNITTTTKKYSNPTHRISGSVSSKAHLQKKKYRAILSGQAKGKDGYNNCRNGERCTLYMSPGPNTKLFMGKTAKQRCIPPRIRGMKQSCSLALPCESLKLVNPRFERQNYTEGESSGFLKITLDHCPLKVGDIISITFLGYPTTINSIFTPNTNTNASSAITIANFTDIYGTITSLNISDLFVNTNTIQWTIPIDIGEGTMEIIIDDGPSETNFLNTNNGATGTIYANVNVPRHINIISSTAWNIVEDDSEIQSESEDEIESCYNRFGSFINSSMSLAKHKEPLLPWEEPNYTSNLQHYVVLFTFTHYGDNLITGDILQISISTNYGDNTSGFFTNVISNNVWNKNERPEDSQTENPPSIWIEKTSDNSIINGAIQSVEVTNFSMNTNLNNYIQILNVTIGNDISEFTGSLRLGIFDNTGNWLSTHPYSYSVNYQISCNCWNSTGGLSGYQHNPCAGRNGSFTNTSMTLCNDNVPASGYPPYETQIPASGEPHFVVYFTFTLTDDSLIDGDVLQFLIKTDYGTISSGFFTQTISNNDWTKNVRPTDLDPPNTPNTPSIWLEDNNGNLISNAIESAQVVNTYLNTTQDDYRQTLSITINTNSGISGTIKLGMYDDASNWLTVHPVGAYNVDYKISGNCWTSTNILDGYDYDPCGGRNGSLTNSSFSAINFDNNTPVGGDFIQLVTIGFESTDAPLVGGDIILLTLTVDYQDANSVNIVSGFWTDSSVAPITLNSNTTGKAIWFTQGTSITPESGMIDSVSISATQVSGTGANQTWSQVMSITLSGTGNYGSDGTDWAINIQGENINQANNITQLPVEGGSIDYEIDLNCFTGTGPQSGINFLPEPPPPPSNMAMIPIRFNAVPDSELGTADALPGYIEYTYQSRSKYSPTINILPSDKDSTRDWMGFVTHNTFDDNGVTKHIISRRYYDNPYSLTDFNTPNLGPAATYDGSGKNRLLFSIKFTIEKALSGVNGDGISITFKRTNLYGLGNGEFVGTVWMGGSRERENAELFFSGVGPYGSYLSVENDDSDDNNNYNYSISLRNFDNYSTFYDISSASLESEVTGNYNDSNYFNESVIDGDTRRFWTDYNNTNPYCNVNLKFKLENITTIAANTNLILTFEDMIGGDDKNKFGLNMKRGTPTNFDLDISGHQLVQDEVGYYSQDLSFNNFNNEHSWVYNDTSYFPNSYLLVSPYSGIWGTLTSGPDGSAFDLTEIPQFKYYYYNKIPKDSILRIYFQVNGNEYFFNKNYQSNTLTGHEAITNDIHDWNGTWNDVPKTGNAYPQFCDPRLCVHVSNGGNQISITDISVNTFSSFTQPGSTNTDISNNWTSINSAWEGIGWNSPIRKTFTDYLQFKFDEEVDSSSNPLIIYMLDTTTNFNFAEAAVADYSRNNIQSKWSTYETFNPNRNINIPVLDASFNTVYAYNSEVPYYDDQWKHHQIHLEVRHPDGYIIGSYLNKPMLKELDGTQNTSDLNNG